MRCKFELNVHVYPLRDSSLVSMQETGVDHTICLVPSVAKARETSICLMMSCCLKGDAVHDTQVNDDKIRYVRHRCPLHYFNADILSLQNADCAAATADPSRELCSQVLQYDERISIHSG